MIRWVAVPFVVFLLIAALFVFALGTGDPSQVPSALIDRPVPATAFPPLTGLKAGDNSVPGFSRADLAQGKVSVVNFWASWCAPCVGEHVHLMTLKGRTGVSIYGVNYKDDATDARRFLGRFGNPFGAVGVDKDGRRAIEWGVYGMPETFVVNGKGEIVHKHVGPISAQSLEEKLLPAVEAARTVAKSRVPSGP